MKEIVNEKQIKQLEEWTELKCIDIIFDSQIDNWSQYTSELNERIVEKKQLIFLIESEDEEKFGYYLHTEVIKRYIWKNESDTKSFHFNLESNGRLNGFKRFDINNIRDGGYNLYEPYDDRLIQIGDILLMKENVKNKSYCRQEYNYFDYHGIESALCGKISGYQNDGENFTIKRFIIVQMEKSF